MNLSKVCKITYSKLSLILAIYIGGFLNYSVFIQRYYASLAENGFTLLVEVFLTILATFWFLRLTAFGGRRFYQCVASLVAVVSAAASYYMIFFGVVIGYGVVASALTLDMDLNKEVIGYRLIIWTLIVSLLPLWLIWFTRLPAVRYSKAFLFKSTLLLIVPVAIILSSIDLLDERQDNNEKLATIDMPSYGGVFAHSYLPANWLSAGGLFAYTQLDELTKNQKLMNPAEHFIYTPPENIDDLYVVFVIGETTRWDHMGILGYSRQTTPYLAKEPNLVAFKGLSCDTATKLSLRCMFVREGGTENNQQHTLKERNVFAVLKSLGFTSDLYAMQSEVAFYNYVMADNFSIRETIAAENQGKRVDDMLLVDQVKHSLKQYPKGKHLIVLHTKGSHYLYSQRYTRDYAKYQPECMGVDVSCSKESLINAYDNSVLYTDSFLKSVFDQLRDKKAIVFYASDHGESIDENSHFHATPVDIAPPEQRRVPILVWGSDALLAEPQYQKMFNTLKSQAGQLKTHRQIYDSVLGCIGYTSPDGGIVGKNNWCAPQH